MTPDSNTNEIKSTLINEPALLQTIVPIRVKAEHE